VPVSRIRWLRELIPPLLAATLLTAGSAAGIRAATYQASIDVNTTGFNPPCDGDANYIVPKMQKAATAAYTRLGHVATSRTGSSFTRAGTLGRTVNDWGLLRPLSRRTNNVSVDYLRRGAAIATSRMRLIPEPMTRRLPVRLPTTITTKAIGREAARATRRIGSSSAQWVRWNKDGVQRLLLLKARRDL
jgi:hypothetical protein